MIEICDPGPLATIQDRGRHGWAHLGVGHSGAADRAALALANRLVGNDPDAAAIECTFGGLGLTVEVACLIAVAGAPCVVHVVDGPPVGHQQPIAIPAGATLKLSAPSVGLRTYLAVRGGIDVPAVMGSRSTDTLSGVGPPALAAGDRLPIGANPGGAVPTEFAPAFPESNDRIRLWPGPRRDWFHDDALRALTTGPYITQSSSNRVGVRLLGEPLRRTDSRDLPSEGLIEGAVQVHADGQPLVFLADHGTTGGYPVIAVVDPGDLPRIAQARPGRALTFRWR